MGEDLDNEQEVNNNEEDSQFDLKSALPIFITIIVIIASFFKIVIPALIPTSHAPSSILEDSTGESNYENLFK